CGRQPNEKLRQDPARKRRCSFGSAYARRPWLPQAAGVCHFIEEVSVAARPSGPPVGADAVCVGPHRSVPWRKETSPLLTETRYEHILLDEAQVPMIAGTTMKVVELILDHLAYGWSPDQLHFQHPFLTMGQVHSALAYYWDHKAELDRDIERR